MNNVQMMQELVEILADESNWKEDNEKPTSAAIAEFERMLSLMEGKEYADGCLCPGDGAIRVEWSNRENCKEFRIQTATTQEGKHYIYWEDEDDYKCIYRPSPEQVAERLTWYSSQETTK